MPEPRDILLGKFNQTIHDHTNKTNDKNTKDDIDIEFYSLDKFLTMLYQGQTVAWELLFTPDSMILEKHPIWEEVRAATPKLLNKKVDAFIGYCKQQAHKYGVRGSRLNTIQSVLEYLYINEDKYRRIFLRELDLKPLTELEHVELIKDKFGAQLLVVCGKKFGMGTSLAYVIPPLQQYYDEYGERSKLAKENKGIDWKALSHAVRVCMQASSLLNDGKILLPMKPNQVTLLKKIKAGELTFETVATFIEEYQNTMLKDRDASTLRAEPDLQAFQELQCDIYSRLIKGTI